MAKKKPPRTKKSLSITETIKNRTKQRENQGKKSPTPIKDKK